ncbi:unnamed protein product [Rotaria sp. Silwood2]|nr:unnamed protein product [Rotaria sp. Silwood2]
MRNTDVLASSLSVASDQLNNRLIGKKDNGLFVCSLHVVLFLSDILSSPSTNQIDELQAIANARRLYNSCMNEETDSVDVLLALINKELGGWPILEGATWNNSTFNLSNMLLKIAEYNLNAIYTIITINDEQNSSLYVAGIGQGSLGLAQPESYASENALTKSYQQWMKDLAMTLTNVTSMIDDDVTSIFELEKKIAEVSWTTAEQIARQKDNVRTTVGNLSNTINSSIDFSKHFRHVYQLANVILNDTEHVIVGELEYLRNVSNIITQYSSRTLQNYFIWRFMMTLIDYMPKQFRATKQQFTQTLDGTVSEEKRTLTCSANINSLMGFALSRPYVLKYFDESARNESLIMIENIRNTFIEMINQSNWMDSISKIKAMAKARAVVENVGYPDYVTSSNVTKLEKDYADYKFNLSYFQNGLTIAKLTAKNNYRLLRQSVDRQTWVFAPTKIEAAYNPPLNSMGEILFFLI